MAKKRASRGFNMAAAIRDVLTETPKLSGREVREAVQKQYPDQEINEKSFGVAFSNARRKLGIKGRGGRKVIRRAKPGVARATVSVAGGVNFDLLQSARKLLEVAGNADTAITAIKQLQALQIK